MDELLDYFTAQRHRRMENQRRFDKSTMKKKPKQNQPKNQQLNNQSWYTGSVRESPLHHEKNKDFKRHLLPPAAKACHSRLCC